MGLIRKEIWEEIRTVLFETQIGHGAGGEQMVEADFTVVQLPMVIKVASHFKMVQIGGN